MKIETRDLDGLQVRINGATERGADTITVSVDLLQALVLAYRRKDTPTPELTRDAEDAALFWYANPAHHRAGVVAEDGGELARKVLKIEMAS